MRHRRSRPAPRGPRRFKPSLELLGCAIGAVLFSVIGAVNFNDVQTLGHRSEIVTGVVVDKRWSLRHSDPTITVRFVTRSGQTVVADTWRTMGEPDIGDQIQVEYDPQEPSRMQDAEWGHDSWFMLLFFAFAAIFVATGIVKAFPRQPAPTTSDSASTERQN